MNFSRQQLTGVGLALGLHLGFAAWWASASPATPPRAPLQTINFSLVAAEEPAPPAPKSMAAPPKPQPASMPIRPRPTPAKTTPIADPAPASAESTPVAAAAPAAAPTGGAPTEQPAVTPPRFDAAYLANPAPPYPGMSRRLGEEGRVLLRVRVGADGLPTQVEIAQSSGFPRLDAAAREAVRGWKFVPARQGERAVAASVNVPIAFKLNQGI
jgi:protein TonB